MTTIINTIEKQLNLNFAQSRFHTKDKSSKYLIHRLLTRQSCKTMIESFFIFCDMIEMKCAKIKKICMFELKYIIDYYGGNGSLK